MITLESPEQIVVPTIFDYLKTCSFYDKREGKNSRSIWFKDYNNDFTVLIYNVLYNSCTALATIDGAAYNTSISKENFEAIFRAY